MLDAKPDSSPLLSFPPLHHEVPSFPQAWTSLTDKRKVRGQLPGSVPLWARGPVTQEHGLPLIWAHEVHFILLSSPRTLGRASVIKRTDKNQVHLFMWQVGALRWREGKLLIGGAPAAEARLDPCPAFQPGPYALCCLLLIMPSCPPFWTPLFYHNSHTVIYALFLSSRGQARATTVGLWAL